MNRRILLFAIVLCILFIVSSCSKNTYNQKRYVKKKIIINEENSSYLFNDNQNYYFSETQEEFNKRGYLGYIYISNVFEVYSLNDVSFTSFYPKFYINDNKRSQQGISHLRLYISDNETRQVFIDVLQAIYDFVSSNADNNAKDSNNYSFLFNDEFKSHISNTSIDEYLFNAIRSLFFINQEMDTSQYLEMVSKYLHIIKSNKVINVRISGGTPSVRYSKNQKGLPDTIYYYLLNSYTIYYYLLNYNYSLNNSYMDKIIIFETDPDIVTSSGNSDLVECPINGKIYGISHTTFETKNLELVGGNS